MFACTLLSFHASEFALQVRFNRSEVSWDTLLLSWPYARSMAAAAVENAIRRTIAPVWATEMLRAGPLPAVLCAVRVAGVALVVVGEGVRKAGILTAGRHFTHDIKQHRRRGHVLVTNGIYRYAQQSSATSRALDRRRAGSQARCACGRRCETLERDGPSEESGWCIQSIDGC